MNSCSILITSLTAITTILAIALPGQAVSLTGLTRDNTLLNFDSNNPTETNTTQVTGVTGNLLGIDFRSANGQLYGFTDTNLDFRLMEKERGVSDVTQSPQ